MLRRRPNVMKISGSVGVRMLEDQNCELEMTIECYHMKFGLKVNIRNMRNISQFNVDKTNTK